MTGSFGTPTNYGQLPSYSPQSAGQAAATSDPSTFLHQFISMDGVTGPVTHLPMGGRHQGMYGQKPLTAHANVSRHSDAQMGGGCSPYIPMAQAAVARDIQPYAGAMMPVYGVNPSLTQAPIMGATPVHKQRPHDLSATARARAARRETRHDPYKPSSASECTEASGEPMLYNCRWGNCSKGPMAANMILGHFRDHGQSNRDETGKVKACEWAGCTSAKFPMSIEGFTRHVNGTQSHAEIRVLALDKCQTCGVKLAKRSMFNHSKICWGELKEPKGKGKKRRID